MTNKTFISTILLSIILAACNRHWIAKVEDEKFVWEKVNLNQSKYELEVTEPCHYEKNGSCKVFNYESTNVYEYDSIRVYISKEDTLLNELTRQGFIQGQYFFRDYPSNRCYDFDWTRPLKVTNKGWTGYHIYINKLREVQHKKIPRKIRNEWPLIKTFRFSFSYLGQPFINPAVFRIDIENSNYKMGQQSLDIEKLLDGGETVWFYQFGVEI